MAPKGTVAVKFIGNTRDLERDMDGLSGKFRSFAKVGVATATTAVVGLGVALGGAVREAAEAARIGRLTEAVIKSTGGAANVTADQVADYAEKLSNLTGVDDELIQEGQNVLLTFTKIRNEVGAGNNIFDQATTAALNMSTALGTDMQSASIQLGKALNDPIAGISALGRAGVQFTQQQKDQIKAMVEAGDTLGAQKIILGELETQFGGAAAAAADPMQRLGVVVGNLQEKVGTALLPVVERFATFLSDTLIPGIEKVVGVFREGGLAGVVDLAKTKFAELWPGIQDALGKFALGLVNWLGDTLPKIAEQLVKWGKALVEWVVPQIPTLLANLGRLLARVADWAIDTGLPKLVEKLLEWGKAFVAWVGPIVADLLLELGKLYLKLQEWIITDALPKIVGRLAYWAAEFVKWVGPAALDLVAALGTLLADVAAWIVETGLPKLAEKLVEWAGAFAAWVPGAIWKMIAALGGLATDLLLWVGGLPAKVVEKLGDLSRVLVEKGKELIRGLIDGIKSAPSIVVDAIDSLIPGDGLGINSGGSWIPSRAKTVGLKAAAAPRADVMERGTTTVNVNVAGHLLGSTPEALAKALLPGIHRGLYEYARNNGGLFAGQVTL